MKLSHLNSIPVVVVALGLLSALDAQQMVPSPGELSIPERAAPSAEITSSPAAEKRPVKAASAPKKEKPATTVPKEGEEIPVARKVPEPAPPPPQNKKGVEAALRKMEDQWEAAIVAHDVSVVDSLVAPDFAGINPQGKFISKSDLIAQVKNDKDTYASSKNEKLSVHVYGGTTAVVTGSVRAKGTVKNGQVFDRTYRYTDTWVQRDGKWQCVASQDSLLSTQ